MQGKATSGNTTRDRDKQGTVGAADSLVVCVLAATNPTAVPFWLIHPLGGHVLWVPHLVRALTLDCAVYAIRALGTAPDERPLESIDAMANEYLRQIRAIQPYGPYRLSGPSLGGTIAYEVAYRLEQMGEHVSLLALVDAYAPNFPRPMPWFAAFIDNLKYIGSLPPLLAVKNIVGSLARRMLIIRRGAASNEVVDVSTSREARLVNAHERALRRYRSASPYRGEIHLLRATKAPRMPGYSYSDSKNGWGEFALGDIHVTEIEGDHRFILDPPHVGAVIREVNRLLSETSNT